MKKRSSLNTKIRELFPPVISNIATPVHNPCPAPPNHFQGGTELQKRKKKIFAMHQYDHINTQRSINKKEKRKKRCMYILQTRLAYFNYFAV